MCGDAKVSESYKIVSESDEKVSESNPRVSESKFLNPTLFRVGVIMEVVSYIC